MGSFSPRSPEEESDTQVQEDMPPLPDKAESSQSYSPRGTPVSFRGKRARITVSPHPSSPGRWEPTYTHYYPPPEYYSQPYYHYHEGNYRNSWYDPTKPGSRSTEYHQHRPPWSYSPPPYEQTVATGDYSPSRYAHAPHYYTPPPYHHQSYRGRAMVTMHSERQDGPPKWSQESGHDPHGSRQYHRQETDIDTNSEKPNWTSQKPNDVNRP